MGLVFDDFHVPEIISFFLLGAVNGLTTGGVLGMSGGVSASAGGGTLVLASVAGIVGLFATSLVAMLFSGYKGMLKQTFVHQDKTSAWIMDNGGSIIVAGIFNGLFFWMLHSLAFFQGAGFFGNALAGGISLLGYSIIVKPLMSSLGSMGKSTTTTGSS